MSIDIDSITGNLLSVRLDTFLTCGQPTRDEEGVCYMPQNQTIFVSGERDQEILEFGSACAVMALGKADATSGLVSESEIKEFCKQFARR